jgi:sodium pump decarboxylase gamma subunit
MEILTTVILGFGVVFLGLLLICALLIGVYKISAYLKKKLPKKSADAEAAQSDELPPEVLVAILTAAVAAYRPEDGGKFRVVSFSRRPNENLR